MYYCNTPDYLEDSILRVFFIFMMFLQEALDLTIFMYHAQPVKYLNNHFYTMVD